MDKFRQYAENQRSQYDATSQSYENAKAQVAPNYDHQRRIAPNYAKLMLSHYFLRQGQFYQPGQTDVSGLKLLDFGCGVGRVMEAFTELGVGAVDGCDISSAMLSHARAKTELANSNFFLTQGATLEAVRSIITTSLIRFYACITFRCAKHALEYSRLWREI